MKNFFKFLVSFSLGLFARAVVRRYRPRIVMVTGSVGKTSTKDAAAAVLSEKFFVRKSEKSFNSEFGVPFTILGVGNPWCNLFAWFKVAGNAFALLFLPNHYPSMLVLETGADRPEDLARILKIATPDMVIVTRLPEISAHVEAYACPEDVREEEFSPAYALSAAAPLIISADDSYSLDNAMRTPARVISYGISDSADIRLKNIGFYKVEEIVVGMQADISVKKENEKLLVKGSVGKTQLLPLAAAVAAGCAFEIPLCDSLKALERYESPPGRGRLLAGKNGSIIIDDSYNASPAAVEEALAALKAFPMHPPVGGRKIAVLGDMLELGRYSIMEHERMAALVADSADVIFTVGVRARAFASVAEASRAQAKDTLNFNNSRDAALALPSLVREGDVILVKGSQSIRMERIVEALLANPSDAAKLVRQEKAWKRKS